MERFGLPFGTAEAEAVGQLALEGVPVLLSLFLGQLEEAIVELLESLVLLCDGRIVAPASRLRIAAATSTTASTTTTSSFALYDY
jgi:hypothetical protein